MLSHLSDPGSYIRLVGRASSIKVPRIARLVLVHLAWTVYNLQQRRVAIICLALVWSSMALLTWFTLTFFGSVFALVSCCFRETVALSSWRAPLDLRMDLGVGLAGDVALVL